MKKIKDNVDACLRKHDLSDRAKLIWVYLAVVKGRGLGATKIAEALEYELEDVKSDLAVLKRQGLIVAQAGKFVAQPFLLGTETVDEADEADEATPIMFIVSEMLGHYNGRRQDAGVPPTHISAAIRRQFSQLAEYLNERGILFADYLDFAIFNTDFLAAQGVKFPPINVVCGDWLKEAYAQPRRPKKSQGPAKLSEMSPYPTMGSVELKQSLLGAGIRTAANLTKDQLRHIQNWAINMLEDPQGFPEPDPQFAPEIRHVYGRLVDHADRS